MKKESCTSSSVPRKQLQNSGQLMSDPFLHLNLKCSKVSCSEMLLYCSYNVSVYVLPQLNLYVYSFGDSTNCTLSNSYLSACFYGYLHLEKLAYCAGFNPPYLWLIFCSYLCPMCGFVTSSLWHESKTEIILDLFLVSALVFGKPATPRLRPVRTPSINIDWSDSDSSIDSLPPSSPESSGDEEWPEKTGFHVSYVW